MRKRNLFVAAYLMMGAATVFTSCSNDDDVLNGGINNGNEDNAVQQIVLQVANAGDGLTTRAGRPLYSSVADQSIENLKLFICDKDNNIVQDTLITDWDDADVYTTGGHGKKMVINLSGYSNKKLTKGKNYTVYAIGYSTDSEYTDGTNSIDALLKTYGEGKDGSNKDDSNETVKTYNPSTNPLKLQGGKDEIFAGQASIEVAEKGGLNAEVVLHRQVAGVFAYVKDVPYVEGATKLRLMATNNSSQLILDKFLTTELTSNGGNTSSNVVNGYSQNAASALVKVAEAELSTWFGTDLKENESNKGILDATNWTNPYTSKANFASGSVFIGDFVIPFKRNTGVSGASSTFVLQLTDKDNNPKRSWIVRLGGSAPQSISFWNGSSWGTESNEENTSHYSVLRNHLYGIGQRNNGDNPTEPGKPDPNNPDVPESLNTKQELELRVNDNWEVIHQMEIE